MEVPLKRLALVGSLMIAVQSIHVLFVITVNYKSDLLIVCRIRGWKLLAESVVDT